MSTAPNPILTRHQLEGMRVRAERVREALHLSESLKGNKDQGASPILGRLLNSGPWVDREDYELVTKFLPLIGWSVFDSVVILYSALRDAYTGARRLVKLKKVTRSADIELLSKIYYALWGVGHHMIIAASNPHHFKDAPPEMLKAFHPFWIGVRLRSTPIVLRTLWAASRFAPLNFKLQRTELEEARTKDSLNCSVFRITASAFRHSKLRDEAERMFERVLRSPVEKETSWTRYREGALNAGLLQLRMNTNLETLSFMMRQEIGGDFVEHGWPRDIGRRVVVDSLQYSSVPDIVQTVIDVLPEELLRWLLVSDEGAYDYEGFKLLMLYLPLITSFDGDDFFLPSRYSEAFPKTNTVPVDAVLKILQEDARCRAFEPVARAATPGRNEPCPCGSGQKYKVSCAGDRSQTMQQRGVLHHKRVKPR